MLSSFRLIHPRASNLQRQQSLVRSSTQRRGSDRINGYSKHSLLGVVGVNNECRSRRIVPIIDSLNGTCNSLLALQLLSFVNFGLVIPIEAWATFLDNLGVVYES